MSIKFRLLLLLIKIRFKLQILIKTLGFGQFERALRLRSSLWWKLKYQLTLLVDSSSANLRQHDFEKMIDLAVTRLLAPHYFDHELRAKLYEDDHPFVPSASEIQRIEMEYKDQNDAIEEIVNLHQQTASLRSTMADYFQIQSFLNHHVRNYKSSSAFADLAKDCNPTISELDSTTISATLRSTRREVRELRQDASSKQAIKISLSTKHITTIVSTFSVLSLVSGYLYTRSILSHFGINSSDYFLLSDYVAASVDKIHWIFFATVLGIITGFVGIHRRSRLSYSESKGVERTDTREYLVLLILAFVGTFITYFSAPEKFPAFLSLSILLLSPRPFAWIVRRYFVDDHRLLVLFVLQSVLLLCLYLFGSISREIDRIENSEYTDLKRYDIALMDPEDVDLSRSIMLMANSRYMFFREDPTGQVYIVPVGRVKSVSVRQD